MSYVHQTHFSMSHEKGEKWAIFQVVQQWDTQNRFVKGS